MNICMISKMNDVFMHWMTILQKVDEFAMKLKTKPAHPQNLPPGTLFVLFSSLFWFNKPIYPINCFWFPLLLFEFTEASLA